MSLLDVNRDGIALDGFDPVSYFNNEPLRGTPEFRSTIDSDTFYFANAENLEKFDADPAKYTPAYGGYCAYSVATENPQRADYSNYKLYGGRLMFFYRNDLEDARVTMENNMPDYVLQADTKWLRQNSNMSEMEMQNLSDSDN